MGTRRLHRLAAVCLLALAPMAAFAQSFVVDDIRVEGLRRVSTGTVFNELPIAVGDAITEEDTAAAIKQLFATGLFEDVRIERDGDTLVVAVVERPSIANIDFTGNEEVETEQLIESLSGVGFAVGRTFDPVVLNAMVQELRETYFAQGRYSASIEATVTPLERHRVGIHFEIDEGEVARIRRINVVGNRSFDEEDLVDLFESTTRTLFSWLTGSDRYSKQKVAGDLERLRTHYLDRGYVNFEIDSTQVSLTPDKRHIYITINVTEGRTFEVGTVELAGDLVVEPEELIPLVDVRQGDVFNRSDVVSTATKVKTRLGDEGYAFANVNAVPDLREDEGRVDLAFFVDPGQRVYVRRIEFRGNFQTRDEVLRREMRQLEGTWVVNRDLDRSRQRLLQLGHFDEVRIETQPVPGTTDQVDVIVQVSERAFGALLLSAGYAQDRGALFNVSVTQENLFGTGNSASVTFNNSSSQEEYSVAYTNPYFTQEGISRRLFARYEETEGRELDISDFSTDVAGAGISFGIPTNEFDRFHLGISAEAIDFVAGADASEQVMDLADATDGSYLEVLGSIRWSRDQRGPAHPPDGGELFLRPRGGHASRQRAALLPDAAVAPTLLPGHGGLDPDGRSRGCLRRRLRQHRFASAHAPLLRRRPAVGAGVQVQLPRTPRFRRPSDGRRLPDPRPGGAHRAAALRGAIPAESG